IARGVREIVEKERSAQSIIERQLPNLQYNLISKMIHGNIADAEKFKKSCEIVGIQLKYKKYCAILVVVSKEDKDSQIEEVSLVKYAIANIISELFNTSEMSSYIDDFGMEELVVVLNFDNLNNAEGKILENCECIKKVIEEQLDVKLQISIGRIYEGMERVPVSYREAEKSMEYKILTNNDDIIFFDESNENDCNYRYSLEQENAIMNAVVLGNVDVAKKLLDQIIEMNANVSVEMSRCLFFDLMSTMFRVLNQQELDLKAIFGNEYPYKLLVNCTTIDELRQTIFEILESICLYIKDNRSGKKEVLKVAMLEYIEKNCENSNLSMETVADAFSVSYTYVSHFFKDYIGENFSNYLMNIRIEKAKKYLKETSLPISEIAQKLGYSNSAGLIRNFKKIAGVTPGKYRECDRE
ncbi:MAG: helix-turn-helix domain-containing protein, partial [Oscillospiraceae bacterium]